MIEGHVTDDGIPQILLSLAGRNWVAIVDTGFNGYLELPEELKRILNPEYIGPLRSTLAAGHIVVEDNYFVEITFDGEMVEADATFVPGDHILVGTRLLKHHRLEVDFPAKTVRLQRAA